MPLDNVGVAARMNWASVRATTRVEEIAYALLGIFDVIMPLLYGEGKRAFIRFQEEIQRKASTSRCLPGISTHRIHSTRSREETALGVAC